MERKEVLIDEETLQERIRQLGKQISRDYDGQDLAMICILKGAMFFFTDLAKNIDIDVEVEVMRLSSYIGEKSSGKIDIKIDLERSIEGKNVLIVEDIVDSGKSMEKLLEHLHSKNPKSVKICALLDKKERREVENLNIDYVGFSIPNHFVIGYGLDLDEKYRNLREINCFTDKDIEEDKKKLKKQLKNH